MLFLHLCIALTISIVQTAPVEKDRGDPICKSRLWYDQTAYICNEDRTRYHYCHYDHKITKEMQCPQGQRCVCSRNPDAPFMVHNGDICFVDDLEDDTFPTKEKDVCEKVPPPRRPLPDPAIFTYRGVYEAEYEDHEEPNYMVKETWSGEVRQDIKKGKYMKINRKNSQFDLVLGKTTYSGNLTQETCQKRETSEPVRYWNRDQFLGGYTFSWETKNGSTVRQTWVKSGSSPYDAGEYFYVSVKDGYTLLGRYSYSEGRDWEDESMLVSSDKDVYYDTTYGVDSTHWFDVPSFC